MPGLLKQCSGLVLNSRISALENTLNTNTERPLYLVFFHALFFFIFTSTDKYVHHSNRSNLSGSVPFSKKVPFKGVVAKPDN